jgi:hypothetical protein
VSFEVRDGDRTVWRLTGGAATSSHDLATPANGCWTWSVDWTGTDDAGRPVDRGSYTLAATSAADEVRGRPTATEGFRW